MLTYEEMAQIEPQLQFMYEHAQRVTDDGTSEFFCGNAVWFQQFKPWMHAHVGWDRKQDDALATAEAYEVAYQTLYDLIPPCRGEHICAW